MSFDVTVRSNAPKTRHESLAVRVVHRSLNKQIKDKKEQIDRLSEDLTKDAEKKVQLEKRIEVRGFDIAVGLTAVRFFNVSALDCASSGPVKFVKFCFSEHIVEVKRLCFYISF